jgi:hypothetical protein
VLELANADERILMTADKDFGELVFRLRPSRVRHPSGALGLPSTGRADAVAQVIDEHGAEMPGAFAVLSAGLVRIRPPR